MLELNFERILHNTDYVVRCLKTFLFFYKFGFSSLGLQEFGITTVSLKLSSKQLSGTSYAHSRELTDHEIWPHFCDFSASAVVDCF